MLNTPEMKRFSIFQNHEEITLTAYPNTLSGRVVVGEYGSRFSGEDVI
jgi:hypothetical protein